MTKSKPKTPPECAQVAENTRLFLALEAPIGPKEVVDFEPVFPDQEYEINTRHKEQSEKNACSTIGSSEGCQEEEGQEQSEGRYCGAPRGKKKQEDFVKKNIELASAAGGQVLMTQAEKERLAELLREMKEEEEDNARGADGEEDVWAGSILAGLGYTPEPSNLEQLIDIDTRLQLLLPPEDFFSVRSPYINRSTSQARGLEAGWEPVGDLQPGEQVLQDVREKRGQERRLQEIQQQLEILGQGHEITCESPRLAEEQLHSLLDECELSQSWSRGPGSGDTTPWDPDRVDADGLRSRSPRLSEALLSGLLRDAYTTSFTRLG
ncbi:fibrous sheath-interacting protein 1 [Polymixia lowei]